MMTAWNANEHIDFNFADFQLEEKINSKNPSYIKGVCSQDPPSRHLRLLIGDDTWKKTEFVQPEVEAAIEKGCRLIGMNLNDCRFKHWLCPWFFADKGAMFIPFSSRIAAEAVNWNKPVSTPYYRTTGSSPISCPSTSDTTSSGNTAVCPRHPTRSPSETSLRERSKGKHGTRATPPTVLHFV